MCLALYLGTECDLSARDRPFLSVQSVSQDWEDLFAILKTCNVYYLGDHTGRSCGFPSVIGEEPTEYYDGMFQGDTERSSDLASVRALLRFPAAA